jgi:hypothetical protein
MASCLSATLPLQHFNPISSLLIKLPQTSKGFAPVAWEIVPIVQTPFYFILKRN